jgi:Fungal specific transcription factor domain
VLKLFPSRKTVDFLVQYFFARVNWLYEQIYAQTFLERYNSWWSQPGYHNEEDIQFGVLILRICVMSLNFLPHPSWPTKTILDVPLDVLESRCNAAACKLDNYQPRKSSVLRVQQLLIYVSTLVNAGNAKDSHAALGEAVKEAQDINLFLEEKWDPMSEFDKETWRKTFWNLYSWDR